MIALAEIIERFEAPFLLHYQTRLLPSQAQALAAMKRCRTSFAPRMLAQCMACGEQRSVPHSCGHRSCPHCQHHEGEVWLKRQLAAQVPATYFMITFTLPAQLRALAWAHQRVVYALLMQCAWETLNTFSHNDNKLRATPGAVGVLHTHNRRLELHPHVHMVMPAAALDAKKNLWRTKSRRPRRGARVTAANSSNSTADGTAHSPSSGGYLFSHKALAKVFRGKLLDALKLAGLALPPAVPEQWVVDCKCVGDGSKALLYLSRYLYRGVIQEKDILRCEDGKVTFQYRDAKTGKMGQRTLAGEDFLWLVLQHVLPKGLRRSRNFGYLHPNSAGAIRVLQLLHLRSVNTAGPPTPPRPTWSCACGQPMVVLLRRLPALQTLARVEASNRHRAQTPRVTPLDKRDKPFTAQVKTMQH